MQVTVDRGNLRTRHHQVVQKRIMVDLGLSQEWKTGAAEHDRSGKPETTSWNTLQKVDPHREEPLHDGSGKPETVDHQFREFRHGQ